MAVSITIRDVPNETRDVLAGRAAASGRSLQEYLNKELQDLAARPTVPEAIRAIRLRARTMPDAHGIVGDLAADRR